MTRSARAREADGMNEKRPADPWDVLGVSADADQAAIRSAYLRAIKEHPPEREPERFEAIRDAYAALRDPRARFIRQLTSTDPEAPVASVLSGDESSREYVGIDRWLGAIAEDDDAG